MHAQQVLAVWDGTDESAARAKVACDILQHHPCFRDGLKSVMHAELHGDNVHQQLLRQ